MNNKHLGIGAVVLIIILGLYFLTTNSPTNQNLTDDTTIATSSTEEVTIDKPNSEPSIDNINPNDIELDFSKLQGKDRLYTEEEGRYENLSEEEKLVLIEAYHCKDTPKRGKWACKEFASIYGVDITDDVQIRALKNGIVVVYKSYEYPIYNRNGGLYIYDLATQELINEFTNFGNFVFGEDYIIRVEKVLGNVQKLSFYKPGNEKFIEIPGSQVTGVDYLNSSNPMRREFPVEFNGKSFTVYQHTYRDCVDIGGEFAPGLLECSIDLIKPIEFDISDLF